MSFLTKLSRKVEFEPTKPIPPYLLHARPSTVLLYFMIEDKEALPGEMNNDDLINLYNHQLDYEEDCDHKESKASEVQDAIKAAIPAIREGLMKDLFKEIVKHDVIQQIFKEVVKQIPQGGPPTSLGRY